MLQTLFGETLSYSDEGNGDSPLAHTPSFYEAAHAIRSLLRFGSCVEEAYEWFEREIAQGQTELTNLGLENTCVGVSMMLLMREMMMATFKVSMRIMKDC